MKFKIKEFFNKLFLDKSGDHVNTPTVIIFGIVPVLFIIYLLLAPVARVIQQDLKAEPMYIISENLNLRSEKSKNAYVIGNYDYGTRVKVYQTYNNKWALVVVGRKKGYMSLEYLVPPKIFYLIDGIFGNELAKKVVTQTAFKKALASYFLQKGYLSDMPNDIKRELYGRKWKNHSVWQFFVLPGRPYFNTYAYGDFNGDKKQDAAFVITNKTNKQNRLVILSINEFDKDNYGTELFAMDMPENWFYIRLAPKGRRYMLDTARVRIPVDGLLIGSNRDASLNDPVWLLLFDGKKFKLYKQK